MTGLASPAVASRIISPVFVSRLSCLKAVGVATRRYKSYKSDIESLEELAKLKSLDDVDPELVRRLINERTDQLNTQNELDMLKQIQSQEKQQQQMALQKFVRPMWIFLLMSSFVYLGGHWIWWKLEYDEREIELDKEVQALRKELDEAIEQRNSMPDAVQNSTHLQQERSQKSRKWYLAWLW
ncbi:LADA_0D03774g1_1 [Lachancea dasiensis]|uniref:LADA_0D03774g1_1 n=1 Tax=Lachancea dasiensis TaxID=1072105 RepID=A0A1G4J551_9SACH|nr:LADA_0D03774g1_1 [Lachancea dasiensis]